MNRILLGLVIFSTVFTACNDTPVVIPQKTINAKVDSIVKVRKVEIDQQAMEDLDHRAAIEVKVKADSIVQAAQAKPAKDTVSKKHNIKKTK
jgi:hypothetical protein